MEREMIRKAEKKDISRIAEILVFDKRIKYRPIFKDDAYCFGKLQILAVSEQYGASDALESILVYDDGIVKGLIRIEKSENCRTYVDYFFQNQGIGSSLTNLQRTTIRSPSFGRLRKIMKRYASMKNMVFILQE